MIDTHAHLEGILCDIDEGIDKIILAAATIETSKNNLILGKKYPDKLLVSVGIHPQEADNSPAELKKIVEKNNTNHLYLIPEINNIIIVINKYIKTTPVSGSINVRKLGINIIKNIFNKNKNSSFIEGLEYLSLKSCITLLNKIIKNIFINSLGWIVPIPGKLNQHLASLIGLQKNKTKIKEIFPNI